ncbi:poly(U)-specific endoribonuclease isoform X1 [Strongylocentrotus purpuratus]|uniref:Uridylate-specific endoribonuclease n=1 Tax=Strongylocentrotus purpuratus TaxID=7668 RepID=A0A7M7NNE8_STRPU|nr:poly(U)-specific endoribonuclease isoform X1 [Strongylocentrotus purpuratus]|eukprot:XP_011679250.1 PREDICTED: poly(U)-specific endoribonuclease isoform X1 [Strongylocentrotus purpuratus]
MLFSPILVLCLVLHIGIAASADSCSGRCNSGVDSSKSCQCNSACETYGDCCTDYQSECLGGAYSCNSRCGESYNSGNPCHCNDLCSQYSNCCTDYDSQCSGGVDPGVDSCSSRCGESYNAANPCHCNDQCTQYSNCCTDYDSLCSGGGNPGETLSSLAEALWEADDNGIGGSDLVFNRQAYLSNYAARNDLSSQPLFTYVNPAKLDTGTWPTFRALLDNYIRFTGSSDTNTANEEREIENFLDEVFNTRVMDLTYDYLFNKGYFSSLSAFRSYVKDIWFTSYTRSGGVLDSSAFEHTFVGEVKNGKVSGYHNWLAFYEDELEGNVNYYGYTSDNEPNQILMQFRLDDNGSSYYKELASIIYGASPEFELAIFTVCFKENPNALSTFTMAGGITQKVQTWDYNGGYIGSAYFSV